MISPYHCPLGSNTIGAGISCPIAARIRWRQKAIIVATLVLDHRALVKTIDHEGVVRRRVRALNH
jgi:hypothetical protein